MESNKVIAKVKKSMDYLLLRDKWLLSNDLSERSIAHKLAEYLQGQFQRWNVDCEYNGDVDRKGNNRKSIDILKNDLKRLDLLRENEELDTEKEYTNRSVFPDIIVHKRGTNLDNLCIIEMKKSTSDVSFNYDDLKLKAYTSKAYDNTLVYPIGIFIEVITKVEKPDYKMSFYRDGDAIGSRWH